MPTCSPLGAERQMTSYWPDVYFGSVAITARDGKYFFSVQLHLGCINPKTCESRFTLTPPNSARANDSGASCRGRTPESYEYAAAVSGTRPVNHYISR